MADDRFDSELEGADAVDPAGQAGIDGLDGAAERPVFNIDGVTYAIDSLPEGVTALINDLLRCSQEQNELQFRVRQLQAAQQTYVALIKQELEAQGIEPMAQAEEPLAA